jgi:hypothetical protein
MIVTKINGVYAPLYVSYIEHPKHVNHSSQEYTYVLSEEDNPNTTFSWAIDKIAEIVQYDHEYPYTLSLLFGLWENTDILSKTPRFAQLEIDSTNNKVVQRMYTRQNYEVFEYSFLDIEDLKSKIPLMIGWEQDRSNRN